ncbi:betaine/proline/choline family ABC transporter ATP-binding protein [Paenarthrobacter sp. PH39-S1]|uniref:ABC transporter ATP-binding protein n=1 Tax=Paenarthrobacter sp. PH39-S1 TaxID=3046204 RepID=UPI0024B9A5B3|nr:betaine/proline/choline family ABC transporter ATP-binding protein [Paenarthrobacter sp. PH39-S1]MDJ0357536.1 betaine/proline/choline family ABC transporter ATP-binding protein [Paenarthrobacter sp. PH39-S1]
MSEKPECSPDTMIFLDGVSKRYADQPKAAVTGLSMEIKRGEFVVLVGPSGCGKTTTLRMINRLVEPSEGRIWIDGKDVTHVDVDRLRRGIGYVIQQIGLLPHLTIAENVALVPKLLGIPKAKRVQRAEELLELVGLEPATYARRYPRQLSGGQQQRVGVARALAADPPVMLMDEPFGAVDPIAREKLQLEFLRLQERIRKTIVFVTHDIDEALRLGDRIAIFGAGSRLAQFDTPLEILSNPADDFVRNFVGAGAAVRRLSLLKVSDVIDLSTPDAGGLLRTVQVGAGETVHRALEQVLAARAEGVCVKLETGATRFIDLQGLLTAAAEPTRALS